MKRLTLISASGFLAMLFSASAMLSQQAVAPTAAPDVLLLVRQEFQFGRETERDELESAVARACEQIAVPNMWISMQSVTGKPESLSFDPFDSFAQIDDAFAAWPQIFAAHADLARMQQEIRALQTAEHTIVAIRRGDLSYLAGSIDLSKARFVRVLEVRLRPGHDAEFAEAFKILRAAYAKIKADTPWVVYQVNVGWPTPTYFAFVPLRTLKQNDDLLAWRPLLREAEGEAAAKRIDEISKDSYLSTESNLYAIRPDLSHVTREFAEGDPQFWTGRSGASRTRDNTKPNSPAP